MGVLKIRKTFNSTVDGLVLVYQGAQYDVAGPWVKDDIDTVHTFLTNHISTVVCEGVFRKMFVEKFGKIPALTMGLYGRRKK